MTLFTEERIKVDPYPLYTELRHQQPFKTIKNPLPTSEWAHVIVRYDDVVAAVKDSRFGNDPRLSATPASFTDAWWTPKFFKAFMSNMLFTDKPDHARLRTLVHKGFTPRLIQKLESNIISIMSELLDGLEGQREIDLIQNFALPLPLIVISEMMGVAEADRERFHKLSKTFVDQVPNTTWGMLRLTTTFWSMERFFRKLVKSKAVQPEDDLTSALVFAEQDGDKLSEDELVAMLFLLLTAGHETTVNLIASGTLALLENPDQLRRFKHNPELAEPMIEELLRYTNPVQHSVPRFAKEDVVLGGNLIRQGDTVLLYFAAANRDESVFKEPNRLDISRRPNKHLAFGMGTHFCLGAPLARLEAKWAFTLLFERYPDLKLAAASDQLKWRDSEILMGLEALPINL
ncbi:MAG: cytochrome P450 [Chloroflexota bacterium]